MVSKLDEDWLRGRASLGAAAKWTTEEMRIIADLGYGLAEQGRNEEAITIFEGLASLAPATGYFQSALGALKLRAGDLEAALTHLNAALIADPYDIAALTNRGELYARAGNREAAINNFEAVLNLAEDQPGSNPFAIRARALMARMSADHPPAETR